MTPRKGRNAVKPEMKTLRGGRIRLETDIETLHQRNAWLAGDFRDVRDSNLRLTGERAGLTTDMETMTQRNATLSDDMDDLRGSSHRLTGSGTP